MVYILPLISNSSNLFPGPWGPWHMVLTTELYKSLSRTITCSWLFYSLEIFFTPALADGFPLGSERQQVSLNLLDSSSYSGRSQQCCSFDGFYSSSSHCTNLFGDCTECTSYNWYHRHFHIPFFFFSSLARSTYLSPFSLCFNLTLLTTIWQVILNFFGWISEGLAVWPRSGDPFISQNPREFCASPSPGWILVYANTIFLDAQI